MTKKPPRLYTKTQALEFHCNMLGFRERNRHILERGFPIITQALVNQLTKQLQNKSILEVGAGTGYLSAVLSRRGLNVRAIDKRVSDFTHDAWLKEFNYFDIETLDVADLNVISEDVTIMSWPDLGTDFALSTAERIQPGNDLYHCGEGEGGCTGNRDFYAYLDRHFTQLNEFSMSLNNTTSSFFRINDRWSVYRKR